jgi:hypothetical protein
MERVSLQLSQSVAVPSSEVPDDATPPAEKRLAKLCFETPVLISTGVMSKRVGVQR